MYSENPQGQPNEALRTALSSELRRALKTRDSVAVSALRAVLHALDNATAIPVNAPAVPATAAPARAAGAAEAPRRGVTAAEAERLLLDAAEERIAAAAEYQRLGHPERAERLRAEARIIHGCLQHLPGAAAR